MSAGLNVFIYLQFKILCNSSFHYLFDPRIISIRVTLFPKMESFPEVLLCSCLLWFVRCIQRSPGAGADYFLPWRQDLTDYPIHSTVRRCFPSLAQENRQNSWGWVSLVRGHNCLALWPGSCSLFRWFLPGLRCFLTDGRCAFLRWIPEGLCLRSPGFFSVPLSPLHGSDLWSLPALVSPDCQLHHLLSGSLADSASVPSPRVGAWKFSQGSEQGRSLGQPHVFLGWLFFMPWRPLSWKSLFNVFCRCYFCSLHSGR